MSRPARLGFPVLALLLLASVAPQSATAADEIAWCEDLTAAFAQAKADQKILMICVNAKHVAGRTTEEPAAKGLREIVYKDARVVEKSKEFVCALLTSEGSAAEFGELRVLGIDGNLVSPQHLFVHPDGAELLFRREYWPYGDGEPAVEALLDMMAKARNRVGGDEATPEKPPAEDVADAPLEGEARAAWIAGNVANVLKGDEATRKAAIDALVKHDEDGDCVGALTALFGEHKKNILLIVAVVRALGRDGLATAAAPIAVLLKHKDPSVRGNAAVSLEYIGIGDKKILGNLRKAADKEKDELVANHMYRALGRCGAQDAKVRALLLKKTSSSKSEFTSYGPAIGLAYFEGDAKAARGVEKILKTIGVPGSRRGGGQNTVKRALVSWTLASIGDKKSGKFVREELVGGLEHVKAFWVDGLRMFWNTVANVCDGAREELSAVEDGVRVTVSFAKRGDLGRYGAEFRHLMDDCRTGREEAGFKPKGDNILNDER